MVLISEVELRSRIDSVLVAAGSSPDNAAVVAEHLVLADLSGVETHGVWQLERYVTDLGEGRIDGRAEPSVLKSGPNWALVTGNWTFGQVAALYATELALRIGDEHGIAIVGLVQAHHIGRLGHYTEIAAERGCIAQVWAGGYSEEAPVAMPFGGRERALHTNPISMAFPAGSEPPIMLDFATTVGSSVKIERARRHGHRLPPDTILDRDGQPTTDPNDFYDGGGHLIFGGHKGYALNLASELLTRIFIGSNDYADPARSEPVLRAQGVTFIVMRADLMTPRASFQRRADEFEQRLRSVAPAAGFDEVLVPGDPERRARESRRATSIPVDDEIWDQVLRLPPPADQH